MPAQHPKTRRPRREDAGAYAIWLNSWDLSMQAEGLSQRTRDGYLDDLHFFAAWLQKYRGDYRGWEDVDRTAVRTFFAWMQAGGEPCPHQLVDDATPAARCAGFAVGGVRHRAVGLQQFFAWWAEEEELPNPLDRVKLPAQQPLGKSQVQVLDTDQLSALIRDAEAGRDFHSRRDAALLWLLFSTGIRRAELAGLRLGDLNLAKREATVTGKGARTRTVRFGARAALALDRYLRARAKRDGAPQGGDAPLWIGHVRSRSGQGMTSSGIYQVVARRGKRLGIPVFPHMLRHTFSHRWLDAGGAEGDLMELNGWESPQMLRHYGASARAARARRAYDRIDVTGGI